MRKYIFFTFIITSALHMRSLSSCPCEFSPEDKRPFFEQYEVETNPVITPQEKEESS
ncbi:MAG TPA: hypothetical protein VKR54_01515 [Candidatus Babeliales bacterium]|nr:hypothetical protein [Candidatus Babeliales bacterium]